jgi:multiple sugar transport system substrate-binding protein
MRPMKYVPNVLLFAICILCGVTAHAETVTLNVAVFPALDKIIDATLPEWNALHPDVRIRVLSHNYGEHHQAMLAALANGEPQTDVMAVEIGHLKQFAESGGLENLSKLPYKGLLYRKKFADYAFPLAANRKGELTAIPADIAPATLFYRRDILDKAGIDESELTASWDAYVKAGKKIRAATGAYLTTRASDIVDTIVRSDLGNGEEAYFNKNNEPVVDAPRFVKAFKLAKAIHEAKLDANMKPWTPEWNKALQRGTIVTYMGGGPWFAGFLAQNIAPKTNSLWRTANLPEGAYLYAGGTYYAIPKNSANKEMAWEFIKFMTMDKHNQIEAFKAENVFPALLEAQIDPFFDLPVDFLGGQTARVMWRNAARRIPIFNVSEYDELAHDIVDEELRKVLDEGKDIPLALHDAKVSIQERIAADSRQPSKTQP